MSKQKPPPKPERSALPDSVLRIMDPPKVSIIGTDEIARFDTRQRIVRRRKKR